MKLLISLVLLIVSIPGWTQFTARIIVTDVATAKQENIYVAGNFNGWNPGDAAYRMKILNGPRKIIVLNDMPEGNYAFKFTRGSWETVETTAQGVDIENHQFYLNSDTTLSFTVSGWRDNFPDKPKPFTASPQVFLMDSAFFIPQLNRFRKIWVYLPKSYFKDTKKRYPVLYMQDGQNLFNEATAAFGEWGIDECLDTLQQQLQFETIVIGIESSAAHRLTEYNPFDNEKYGKGEGDAYVSFLVKTLKPFVDEKYRTMNGVSHTFIAGSSMGALISFYAILQYPEVFGSVGAFSPSFWIAPEIFKTASESKWSNTHRFFFYAGGKEPGTVVKDVRKMEGSLNKNNPMETREIVYPLGDHSEKYWRMQFPNFYRWLVK